MLLRPHFLPADRDPVPCAWFLLLFVHLFQLDQEGDINDPEGSYLKLGRSLPALLSNAKAFLLM